FVLQFASADAGFLTVSVNDTSANMDEVFLVPFSALPAGGTVSMPYSAFSSLIDFHHIASVGWEIESVPGGPYDVQAWRTGYVPEPATSTLLALALMGLSGFGVSRRARSK